jgi:prepilin peptidase CpaA
MMLRTVLLLLPMFALLGWAAIQDVRTRRIPNWLTLALAASGILKSFVTRGGISPAEAGLGLLVGFAIPFLLFALGALGGGDVKLLAGIGAWLGAVAAVEVFIVAAIVGLVIVLVQCAWQGRLLLLFKNSAVLAINLVHIGDVGVKHATETGRSMKSIDRPLPYAIPLLIATLFVANWML